MSKPKYYITTAIAYTEVGIFYVIIYQKLG